MKSGLERGDNTIIYRQGAGLVNHIRPALLPGRGQCLAGQVGRPGAEGGMIISKVAVCCLNGCFRKPPSTKTPSTHHTLHTLYNLSQQVQQLAMQSLFIERRVRSLDKMNWDWRMEMCVDCGMSHLCRVWGIITKPDTG